jgi:hypothetical protein
MLPVRCLSFVLKDANDSRGARPAVESEGGARRILALHPLPGFEGPSLEGGQATAGLPGCATDASPMAPVSFRRRWRAA